MKKALFLSAALAASVISGGSVLAADYKLDTAHSFVTFQIKHLGYSNLQGRFDKFDGGFTFDEGNPEASSVSITIDTASVNSNFAERDKHLRSSDFLSVEEHPTATFKSTKIAVNGDGKGVITGDLTLNGVTRSIDIEASHVGGGNDPWGGYRQGFTGSTKIALADFGIDYNLGPASREVELKLNIEGVKQ